jgi:hypothetical protein
MKTTHLILRTALLIVATVCTAQADDRKRDHKSEQKEHHNYIIERQEAYQVQGVPTERMIIGKREIDIYPNGMMFEGNNLVGVRQGR